MKGIDRKKLERKIAPLEKLLERKKNLEEQLQQVLLEIREFLLHKKKFENSQEEKQLKEKARGIIDEMKQVEEEIRKMITKKKDVL